MGKKLLENKNALPFEAQKHCKLSLEDIKDIQRRYAQGESTSSIQEDYYWVSVAAINYWAYRREDDLQRRKNADDYKLYRKRDKSYMQELQERRIEHGLQEEPTRKNNPTGIVLTQELKEGIIRLYETLQFSSYEISKLMNIPDTLVRSTLQSKTYCSRYKVAKNKREKARYDDYKRISELLDEGFSVKDIADITGYKASYIGVMKAAKSKPEKYSVSKHM